MKKSFNKIAFLIIIVLIILLFSAVKFMLNQMDLVKEFKSTLEPLNYCSTKQDCLSVGHRCPLGCDILVNKNEAQKAMRQINLFNFVNRDKYQCEPCPYFTEIDCVQNQCVKYYDNDAKVSTENMVD